MTGYDFNGVVDTGKWRPTIKDVIITGNTDVETVLSWLKAERIMCAVYFPPKNIAHDNYAAAVWKSMMINLLGVKKYYDDNTEQCAIMSSACPDCQITRVF